MMICLEYVRTPLLALAAIRLLGHEGSSAENTRVDLLTMFKNMYARWHLSLLSAL